LALSIPVLNLETEIVGVPMKNDNWDITWLGTKAGYLYGSAYPTRSGNSVITGHVWNADGSEGIFLGLEKLKYGDQIIIKNFGSVYSYSVIDVKENVAPNEISQLFRKGNLDYVTLFTCQHYNEANNAYDARIVVRAVLTSVTAP